MFSIDGNGVPNKQLLIFGSPAAAPGTGGVGTGAGGATMLGSRPLVVAARTDANGYFSTDYPRDTDAAGNPGAPRRFDSAVALVPGAKSLDGADQIPVPLGTFRGVDGAMPVPTLQVVKLSAEFGDPAAEPDCARAAPVPRTPENADLVNAPGTYSDDLVSGCVSLTKPNRAIEEFSFYTAVRTTDPELFGPDDDDAEEAVPETAVAEVAAGVDAAASAGGDRESFTARNALSAARVKGLSISGRVLAKGIGLEPSKFSDLVLREGLTRKVRGILGAHLRLNLFRARSPVSKDNPIEWDGDRPR
ncbi:MAG: hypothetical protein ACAI43_05470 [Phycisphaerae bacterium]